MQPRTCDIRKPVAEVPPVQLSSVAKAKEMLAAECERRKFHDAAAYYRDGRCPDDQLDVVVIAQALEASNV